MQEDQLDPKETWGGGADARGERDFTSHLNKISPKKKKASGRFGFFFFIIIMF